MGTDTSIGGAGSRSRLIAIAIAAIAVLLLVIWIIGQRQQTATTPAVPTTTPLAVTTVVAEGTLAAQQTAAAQAQPTELPPPAPPLALISGPTSGTVGQPLNFDASASSAEAGIATYLWDMGDGNRANDAQVVHAYDLAGTYVVVLTVVDAARQVASARQSVTVIAPPSQPPTAVISGATAAQVGETVNFNASASVAGDAAITRYDWNFGDGTLATGETVSHQFTQPGTFHVVLNVTDANGLADTASQAVQVTAPQAPQAVISAPSQTRAGQTVTFDGGGSSSGSPITSYRWAFGDGASSNAVVAQHVYRQAGGFQVTLTITDQTGATNTAQHSITVEAEPSRPPTAAFSGPTSAMVNELVTFDGAASQAGSSPIARYTWSINGIGAPANGSRLDFTFTSPATYVVGLIVTDQNGLSDATSQEITILPELDGIVWYLDGSAPPITLTVANGSGGGSAGCNTYNVAYTASGNAMTGQVTVTGITSTQRMCEQQVMAAEQAYLTALQAVTSYTINANILTLSGPGGTLNFTAR